MEVQKQEPILHTAELDRNFVSLTDIMKHAVYRRNADKGFWDEGTNRNKGELMALMHSEISEMLEAVRKDTGPHGPLMSEKTPEFTAEEEELADLFIRGFDYAGGFNLRLGEAILAKLHYNATRPHKHGKRM